MSLELDFSKQPKDIDLNKIYVSPSKGMLMIDLGNGIHEMYYSAEAVDNMIKSLKIDLKNP